ncbi:MAG TPA: transglycosylase family protein [Solirubrobacterales bacterium]
MSQLTLGLAIATSIWTGTAAERQAIVCPVPVSDRCLRRMRHAQRFDRALAAWRKHRRNATKPWRGWLYSTRMCESHSNYRIDSYYDGAYQFSLSTWRSVGGRSLPYLNPPLEQDYRAVLLVTTGGTGHWPVCG